MTYPTVNKSSVLKDVLDKIKQTGVPEKFTNAHMKTIGFSSSNDFPAIAALKFVGFLDGSGVPTQRYKEYRGVNGQKILAQGIRDGYSDLFTVYPDADVKDNESLIHFFATKTNVGNVAQKSMVATFKALSSMADFEASDISATANTLSPEIETTSKIAVVKAKSFPSVNINIELQIPATNDPEVYRNFFEAMKKYLLTD